MGTRTLADFQPTAGEIALNTYIHGFSGHSLVTPHAALKQLWWTERRIEAKVNRRFVISRLRGEEREFLKRPLAYGEGLTDNTYIDFILERAKRLFLILTEIGCSDQIFGVIDDCWTDDDLPIALEDVPALELSYDNDEALNRRFFKTQFTFLLRTLRPDAHIEYGPQEHIPIEYVSTLPPAVALQSWDRVHFPNEPERVFVRRKFSLGHDTSAHNTFLPDVRRAQQLRHQHIAPVWATYTSDDNGFVLSNFVPEHTLQTFLDHRTPMQLMKLPAERRPVLLCEWMHCLADALAYLHCNGVPHGAIRPSNIIIDNENRIAFADIGTICMFQQGKRIVKNEIHDYAAPESDRNGKPVTLPSPSKVGKFSFSRLRKLSISTSGSSSDDCNGGYDSAYGSAAPSRPGSVQRLARDDSVPSLVNSLDSWSLRSVPAAYYNFSRPACSNNSSPERAPSARTMPVLPRPTIINPASLRDLPAIEPSMSDIYSLGCIFLDIVTFVMRGKLNDFVKFRTTKVTALDGRITMDASFQACAEKVDEWMETIEEESLQYAEQIYHGIPEVLRLIREMLMQNASMRPTATQVRDRIGDILAITCGAEDLCCTDRAWHMPAAFHDTIAIAQ